MAYAMAELSVVIADHSKSSSSCEPHNLLADFLLIRTWNDEPSHLSISVEYAFVQVLLRSTYALIQELSS